MKRLTQTLRFCPIRWIRMTACSSTAGFHHGSCEFIKREYKYFRTTSACPDACIYPIFLQMLTVTIINTLEAAVRFKPTPPAFSDINNTWNSQIYFSTWIIKFIKIILARQYRDLNSLIDVTIIISKLNMQTHMHKPKKQAFKCVNARACLCICKCIENTDQHTDECMSEEKHARMLADRLGYPNQHMEKHLEVI